MQIIEFWIWLIVGFWACLILYYIQWATCGKDYDKEAQDLRDLWHKNNSPKK